MSKIRIEIDGKVVECDGLQYSFRIPKHALYIDNIGNIVENKEDDFRGDEDFLRLINPRFIEPEPKDDWQDFWRDCPAREEEVTRFTYGQCTILNGGPWECSRKNCVPWRVKEFV